MQHPTAVGVGPPARAGYDTRTRTRESAERAPTTRARSERYRRRSAQRLIARTAVQL